MFGANRDKATKEDWLHDADAARREALRRIANVKIGLAPRTFKASLQGVAELFLSDLTALAELPEEISELSALETLYLGRALNDDGTALGLTHLRDINALSSLVGLKYLSLSDTAVTDLTPLKALSRLETLDMEGIPATSLEPIANLPSLTQIYLANSRVADLSPLARLPSVATHQFQGMGIKNTPPVTSDPRLELLTRLQPREATREVLQYLAGLHPAFSGDPALAAQNIADALQHASPVRFVTHKGIIEACNQEPRSSEHAKQRLLLLRVLRDHAGGLVAEARLRQVPEAVRQRLDRYSTRLEDEPVLFLSLDAPMSFIRGMVDDAYLTDATDGGFVAACRHLVELHDQLKADFIEHDVDLSKVELNESVDDALQTLERTVGSTISAVSNSALAGDVGTSVVTAMEALREYADAAKVNLERRPGLVKRGLVAVASTLSAFSAAATAHRWSVSREGSALIETIKEMIKTLIRLLGFGG